MPTCPLIISSSIRAITLTFLLLILSPCIFAEEYNFQGAKSLLPLVRNYLNLNLCANVAYNYDLNMSLGERYQKAAGKLQDEAIAAGWSSDDFAAAMVLAFEEKEDMAVRDDDTPESFNRRHYSGSFCEEQLTQAAQGVRQ